MTMTMELVLVILFLFFVRRREVVTNASLKTRRPTDRPTDRPIAAVFSLVG